MTHFFLSNDYVHADAVMMVVDLRPIACAACVSKFVSFHAQSGTIQNVFSSMTQWGRNFRVLSLSLQQKCVCPEDVSERRLKKEVFFRHNKKLFALLSRKSVRTRAMFLFTFFALHSVRSNFSLLPSYSDENKILRNEQEEELLQPLREWSSVLHTVIRRANV